MTKIEFTPAPIMTIEDLETLKVVSDPFRVQILEVLVSEPQSINQVAEKLGLPPSKLYYHVNMLEKHGLIQVVDTTVHGNIIEKFYWVSAYDLRMDESLCRFGTPEGTEGVTAMIIAPLEAAREDIIRSLEARSFNLEQGAEPHPRNVFNSRVMARISDEKAEEFDARLKELCKEFSASETPEDNEDAVTWGLAMVFYPSFYYDPPQEDKE